MSLAQDADRGIDRVDLPFLRHFIEIFSGPRPALYSKQDGVVESSVARHGNRELAQGLLAFIRSPEGQRILADYGFRPIDTSIASESGRPPLPSGLFKMADLGGWALVQEEVYGPAGLWTRIFAAQSKGR
ncbi:MAG: substrate-binding domain-containing protein [Isosphaeraceae bacterium]